MRASGRKVADLRNAVLAIELRHGQVHGDQLGAGLAGQVDGHQAVGGEAADGDGRQARAGDQAGDAVANDQRVVDDQHAPGGSGAVHAGLICRMKRVWESGRDWMRSRAPSWRTAS